ALIDLHIGHGRRGAGGFGVVARFGRAQTLVVIVHGDGERLLGVTLADHILIQKILDLPRRGYRAEQRLTGGELALLLADDVVRQIDAIGADINVVGAFDHRSDVAGGFSAEAARGNAPSAEAARGILRISRRGRISRSAWSTCASAGPIGSGHRLNFLTGRLPALSLVSFSRWPPRKQPADRELTLSLIEHRPVWT